MIVIIHTDIIFSYNSIMYKLKLRHQYMPVFSLPIDIRTYMSGKCNDIVYTQLYTSGKLHNIHGTHLTYITINELLTRCLVAEYHNVKWYRVVNV